METVREVKDRKYGLIDVTKILPGNRTTISGYVREQVEKWEEKGRVFWFYDPDSKSILLEFHDKLEVMLAKEKEKTTGKL